MRGPIAAPEWSNCLVIPDGVSTRWGAPELVKAVLSMRTGLLVMVDGRAADMWSVGIVLFYLVRAPARLTVVPVLRVCQCVCQCA